MKKIFIKSSLSFLGAFSVMPAFFISLASPNINLKETRNTNKENVHFSKEDIKKIEFGSKELSGDYTDINHPDAATFGNPFELNYFCNEKNNQNFGDISWDIIGCIKGYNVNEIAHKYWDVYWPESKYPTNVVTTPWGTVFPIQSDTNDQPGLKNMGSFFNILVNNGVDNSEGPFQSNNNSSGLKIKPESLNTIHLDFILPEFRDMKIYLDENTYKDKEYSWSASMRVEGANTITHPLDGETSEKFIYRYDLKDMTISDDASNDFVLQKKELMPDNLNKYVVENPPGTWIPDADNYGKEYFELSTSSAFETAKQKSGNYYETGGGIKAPLVNSPSDENDDAWLYKRWINHPDTKLENYQLNQLQVMTTSGLYEYRLDDKVKWETKMYSYKKGARITYSHLYNFGHSLNEEVIIEVTDPNPSKPWSTPDKVLGIIITIWSGSVILGTIGISGVSYFRKKNYIKKK